MRKRRSSLSKNGKGQTKSITASVPGWQTARRNDERVAITAPRCSSAKKIFFSLTFRESMSHDSCQICRQEFDWHEFFLC
jgi:hypothetical protein